MLYEYYLVCTGCYWIAPFGLVPRSYTNPEERELCDLCGSTVKAVYIEQGHSIEITYSTIYDNNSRCGKGLAGTTDEEFAILLLYGDKNDIEHWINPPPKVL